MAQFAKTTEPTLSLVLDRPRLFALLDECCGHQVVWIRAPAGFGKTVLVASYLRHKEWNPVWYKLDSDDGDAASFFYYYADAARAAADADLELPSFTAEYIQGVRVFARNYFGSLLDRLERPVLVFDDYQNLPEDSLTQDILASVLAELPRSCRAIVVSRKGPPSCFARLQAGNVIAQLAPEELLLTRSEVAELLAVLGLAPDSRSSVDRLHELSQGWAAGCILLAEKSRLSGTSLQEATTAPPAVMFDYFAREVFRLLDEESRELLLRTAFLPSVKPGWAESITGNPDAGAILEGLAQRNYFTFKRSQPQVVYDFHPLFSGFVRQHAIDSLDAGLVQKLKRHSAEFLTTDGQTDAAVEIWRDLRDWDGIAQAVVSNAAQLLSAGRNDTLQRWLRHLPEDYSSNRPHLCLWKGMAFLPMNLEDGRVELTKSWRQFCDEGDYNHALVAWGGVCDSYVFRQNYAGLREWIVAAEDLIASSPTPPSEEAEARVATALAKNLWAAWPDYPHRDRWERRSEELARFLNPNLRVQYQALYIASLCFQGKLARASLHLGDLRTLLKEAQVLPLFRLTAYVAESLYGWFAGEWACTEEAVEEGLRLSLQSGIRVFDVQLCGYGASTCLSLGDTERASDHLEGMRALVSHENNQDLGFYHHLSGWHALVMGNLQQAMEHELRVRESFARNPFPGGECLSLMQLAAIEYEAGKPERADETLRLGLRATREHGVPVAELTYHLIVAEQALRRGDEPVAAEAMKTGLSIVRERGICVGCGWRRLSVSRLLAFSLERSIEVDAAHRMIRVLGLAPPPDTCVPASWPVPILISVLGGFSVVIEGKALEFPRRAKRRPLELLMALISLGGDQVQQHELADMLWPDSEGDTAAQALATTLHRLRKLVGHDGFIGRQSGMLSLDKTTCSVDLWNLEALIDRVAAAQSGGRDEGDGGPEDILAMYKPFLGQEPAFWALACRQRLKRRVMRTLRTCAERRMGARLFTEAIPLYEGMIEVDGLAEDCYRNLMRCLARLGRSAEVVDCYSRCKENLLRIAGLAPSAETAELFRRLRSGNDGHEPRPRY